MVLRSSVLKRKAASNTNNKHKKHGDENDDTSCEVTFQVRRQPLIYTIFIVWIVILHKQLYDCKVFDDPTGTSWTQLIERHMYAPPNSNFASAVVGASTNSKSQFRTSGEENNIGENDDDNDDDDDDENDPNIYKNKKEAKRLEESHHILSDSSSTQTTSKYSWCSKFATCQNSPMCKPCKKRFLIIIASGRSASTSLTWMLDLLPGIRMSGENMDVLKRMYTFISQTRDNAEFQKGMALNNENGKTAWSRNPIPPGSFACAAQPMIQAINPPPSSSPEDMMNPIFNSTEEEQVILGFKTVRLHTKENHFDKKSNVLTFQDLTKYVDFIKEMFPCSRIVINYRSDTTSQATSRRASFGQSRRSVKEMVKTLDFQNDKLKRIAELLGPQQAFLMDSSIWTKDINIVNDLVDWLGYSEDCHFKELLEFNTQGENGYKHGKQHLEIHPECRYDG